MARNEHVVRYELDCEETIHVQWLDGPEANRPAISHYRLTEGMKPGDVWHVRVWSCDGHVLGWQFRAEPVVEDIAPKKTADPAIAPLMVWARQSLEREQRRAKEREALMQAGWLTTHDRVEVRLTTATEGPPVSFSVSYDDGKPEPQPETEGQRLARFFATSAHEGHERRPPTWNEVKARVSWPDDRAGRDADGNVYAICYRHMADPRAIISVNGEWSCTVWANEVKPAGHVNEQHPAVVEAQGALRVLAAALKQEWERG